MQEEITSEEKVILDKIRELDYGSITVKIHDGKPANIEVVNKYKVLRVRKVTGHVDNLS